MPCETRDGQGRKTHIAVSPLCVESSPVAPRQSLRCHCPNDPEGGRRESCGGDRLTPLRGLCPLPEPDISKQNHIWVYLMFTDRMEAGRQLAEHMKHLEPDIHTDIHEVVL